MLNNRKKREMLEKYEERQQELRKIAEEAQRLATMRGAGMEESEASSAADSEDDSDQEPDSAMVWGSGFSISRGLWGLGFGVWALRLGD